MRAATRLPKKTALENVLESEKAAEAILRKECPWYCKVEEGASASEPMHHCSGPADEVKCTPHTAEASTVDKPTVLPGGPGLFHHKGLHLPPYIQHLWHHLQAQYGKEKAYAVAVGVVKKWAAGTAPGGKPGGKPRHTHPDVQAAAQRNVAEWDKDRTMGGKKGA